MKTSERLKKIQDALTPVDIPAKPAGKPTLPAHLAKILDASPASLSRWMKDEVEPRGKQKDRIDLLYRTACEAEAGNSQAKEILRNLVKPIAGAGVLAGASVGTSLVSLGLIGVIAAAGLRWLLSDKETDDE